MAPQPPKPPANIEIRAPAELLLGVPVGLQANWRHQPADLVAGLIKYEVNVSLYYKHFSFFIIHCLLLFYSTWVRRSSKSIVAQNLHENRFKN